LPIIHSEPNALVRPVSAEEALLVSVIENFEKKSAPSAHDLVSASIIENCIPIEREERTSSEIVSSSVSQILNDCLR
jgi:predicted nucleic-acid-binding protein